MGGIADPGLQPGLRYLAPLGLKKGGIPPHGGVSPPLRWARLAERFSALPPGGPHSPASFIGGTTGKDVLKLDEVCRGRGRHTRIGRLR